MDSDASFSQCVYYNRDEMLPAVVAKRRFMSLLHANTTAEWAVAFCRL